MLLAATARVQGLPPSSPPSLLPAAVRSCTCSVYFDHCFFCACWTASYSRLLSNLHARESTAGPPSSRHRACERESPECESRQVRSSVESACAGESGVFIVSDHRGPIFLLHLHVTLLSSLCSHSFHPLLSYCYYFIVRCICFTGHGLLSLSSGPLSLIR